MHELFGIHDHHGPFDHGHDHQMHPGSWLHGDGIHNHTLDFYGDHFAGTFHTVPHTDIALPAHEIPQLKFEF